MKRHTTRVVVLLLAAVIVNVAVAFVCRWTTPMRVGRGFRTQAGMPQARATMQYALWHDRFPPDQRSHSSYAMTYGHGLGWSTRVLYVGGPAYWAAPVPVESPRPRPADVLWIVRAGFPFDAFEGDLLRPAYGRTERRFVLEIEERLLPFRPLWLGLLLNVAIYYAIIEAALFTLLCAIRRRRMRKGLCPACGYDLRGEFDGGCPECGWKRGDQ